ncbi:MAG: rod shape-determining protein [Clostridia bacterium]|nr:rod shape-determining protein [Clostridia bacterium]
MVSKIGLDLGYANITLSDVTTGIYREPSVALINKNTRRIISVGDAAMSPDASQSEEAMLVRPFKNGLLFDHKITQSIITSAINPLLPADRIRCVLGVPSDFLPKQERVLFDMLNNAGVTDCYSVNRALAALIGAGYSPLMSVISVNVGAASTEIAVLNEGVITQTSRESIGGEDFDKAVKQYIFEQGDVNVSLSVARAIKEKLGSVWSGKPSESVEIEGTLSLTGNKVRMNVTTEDIVGVFEKPLHRLFMAIAEVVKRIPLDHIEQTFNNGIILTGGGSIIYGLDKMMSKVLGIPVTQPEDPLDSVAKGLSRINSFIPVKGRSANKNITNFVPKYYQDKKQGSNN